MSEPAVGVLSGTGPIVAHVISVLGPGGAEAFVRDLASQVAAKGLRQAVICLRSRRSVYGRHNEWGDFQKDFQSRLELFGIPLVEIQLTGFFDVFRGALRFRRVNNDFGTDILHVHTPLGVAVSWLARSRRRLLFTHHGGRFLSSNISTRGFFWRLIDEHITICKADYRSLSAKLRSINHPVHFIPNGVDLSRFSTKRGVQGNRQQLQVISVGRLDAVKNFSGLLRAFMVASQRIAESGGMKPGLRIVGDGPERCHLERQVNESPVRASVEFLGIRSDIPRLLGESDVFALFSHRERLPVSVLEAMASGLPCVVTKINGNRELIDNGRSGYLVSLGDESQFASSLQRVLTDEAMRLRMGQEALRRAELFSIELAAERYQRLYERRI